MINDKYQELVHSKFKACFDECVDLGGTLDIPFEIGAIIIIGELIKMSLAGGKALETITSNKE